ncbi:hypothetical protein K438DRAFT_1843827, partial [Mycena galopus ATCC 62051]
RDATAGDTTGSSYTSALSAAGTTPPYHFTPDAVAYLTADSSHKPDAEDFSCLHIL